MSKMSSYDEGYKMGRKVSLAEIRRMKEALKIAREYVAKIDGMMSFTPPENRVTRPDLDFIDAALMVDVQDSHGECDH
jgi:hypothetical protein